MFGGLDLSLAVAAGLVLPLEDAASAATGVAALSSRAQTSPVRDAQYVYGGGLCMAHRGVSAAPFRSDDLLRPRDQRRAATLVEGIETER